MSKHTIINLGKRRIQQARYTYTVPLPPVWIRAMGIKKGDSVVFELIEDNNLKIVPADAHQDPSRKQQTHKERYLL